MSPDEIPGYGVKKIEVRGQEAIEAIQDIIMLGKYNIKRWERAIFLYGKTELRILYFLWQHDATPLYTPEIVRICEFTGMSRSQVYESLRNLESDGYIYREGPLVRLVPDEKIPIN